jgi:glycerol-3-phosphate dehydrogenase (NAD(P)+)
MKIGILGAGTWGVGLATILVGNDHDVTVWSYSRAQVDEILKTKEHKNLSGITLPDTIRFTADMENACADKELIIFVVPSVYMRDTARASAPYLPDGCIIASASKGMEKVTLKTMTDVIEDEIAAAKRGIKYDIVALSGPTHAEEVVRGIPTSIVAACKNEAVAANVAQVFSNSCLRAYTNTDVLGVELCGALKNIIAMAAGALRGVGLGDNTLAMLITRGVSEMARIGAAMGCSRDTFMGLAGIGDLIVTCTSVHSRNNRCGELIGRGMSYDEAAREIGMVVEGYYALEAAMELSRKYGVEMPITEAVYDVIHHGVMPADAINKLMNRKLKSETV